MKSTWINPAYISELVNTIRDCYSLTSDGNVSYKIQATFFFDTIFGLIKHNHKLDENTLHSTLKETIDKCYKKNKISNHNDLLLEFDKSCNLKAKKQETYKLITQINIKNIYKLPTVNINDCRISFHNTLPKKYYTARHYQLTRNEESDFKNQESYTFVCITTSAANTEHAVNNAIDTLSCVRALLQIGFKKNRQLITTSKEREYPTKSVVQCGEVHTLHHLNGKRAGDGCWINLSFEDNPALTLKSPPKTLEHLRKNVSRLKKCPYITATISALINYIDATDRADPELRFMKLWSTLERLTMTHESAALIKRASFFYQDRILHQAILESLRTSRNTHIHGGHPPINIELKNFQLCAFIEHLVAFFIMNPFKFSTTDDIKNLISLPTQAINLKTQIAMLKTVQKFIGESPR
ncbi:hypothetical protein [Pseudomonas sp. GM25]|uniref:hypothetical protein n=1 Tax=Pseudomonas sp. GM25 TaxID=1144327 RepID=UPI0002702E50|nr:hypothetical protein [Pseudomonas sp. GM25]EJM26807.1 hypothetical protein PMI24_03373 [Pseudomonas sp. GM25]